MISPDETENVTPRRTSPAAPRATRTSSNTIASLTSATVSHAVQGLPVMGFGVHGVHKVQGWVQGSWFAGSGSLNLEPENPERCERREPSPEPCEPREPRELQKRSHHVRSDRAQSCVQSQSCVQYGEG